MDPEVIEKLTGAKASANMTDYDDLARDFSWTDARLELDLLPDGKLNIAHEAIERTIQDGGGDRIALRLISKSGEKQDVTYSQLSLLTNRFANVLRARGFAKGDRVFSLLGRTLELYVAALGTLKAGCVFCPLFQAFGPEPIRDRMEIGGANLLITSGRLYRRKVKCLLADLPDLREVMVLDADVEGTKHFATLMDQASESFATEPMDPEDLALLHFTSGTTGKPKGVMHVHEAVVAHRETGRIALDMRPGDIYWCTADPGWVTGTSYGIIAPLTNGVTMIVDEAEFDVERWYG
ncbi:MAG: AMP-binding protein, partial [Pseudomonadota bacterium]